ncbi:MAG TPA: phosphate-starvation-inducible PsiE family protein [Edaphobacter sp.]|nr:phosphate-starvation-inducible PsiE family protein [Edaphobacter sp.]
MTSDPRSPATRPRENRFQLFSSESLSPVEMFIYAAIGVILSLAAMFALFMAGQTLWRGLAAGGSAKTVVEVIDRLLVVLLLVEILHTVRISIRSHTLVTEPFLVVGLIATIRRMLVITLDAANLTSAANWAADGQARLRASLLELGLLGAIVIVLVISIHILRKSQSSYEEQETKRAEGSGSGEPAKATPA